MCVKSTAKGQCGPYRYPDITGSNGQNTFVGQDVWNPIPGWHQTTKVVNPGNWYATANMPAGNTAVVSFPNLGEVYNANPLSSYSSIYSSFTENMHTRAGTSAEAAFDIWLNNWGNEVMIQNNIVNRGSCAPSAVASFGGSGGVPVQKWNLCVYGSELIWQLPGRGEQSGTVDVLAMLNWLEHHKHHLPSKSNLTDISYGFEVCSTGSHAENFTVSGFTLKSSSA